MFALSLLVFLTGAVDLGNWDFQPWENVAPSNSPVGSAMVANHRLRGVVERRSDPGSAPDTDTLHYWTDARGVCRSTRWWRPADSTTLETLDWYGVKPGRNALPPDSGRTSRIVAGRLRENGTLRSQHSGRRSIWVYSRDPIPEGFRYDWDSVVVERDEVGRITSKREVWTDFAWYSDSIAWGADGSPSLWITRSGGAWTEQTESHRPTWSKGRLVGDEVRTIEEVSSGIPDTTEWKVTCSWVEDTLLRNCTSKLLSTRASRPSERRRFDSLVVLRDGKRRPRRLESRLNRLFQMLVQWDSLGRMVSQRSLDSNGLFVSLSVDSMHYGDLPWPVRFEYGYAPASTLFDGIALDDVSTIRWDLDPELLGISGRMEVRGIRVVVAGDRLRLAAASVSSGTVRLFDPAGRERTRTPLRGGRAELDLPRFAGVWLWRLEDGKGNNIGQGRISVP